MSSRVRASSRTRPVTVTVPEDTVERALRMVAEGHAVNMSDYMRRALELAVAADETRPRSVRYVHRHLAKVTPADREAVECLLADAAELHDSKAG